MGNSQINPVEKRNHSKSIHSILKFSKSKFSSRKLEQNTLPIKKIVPILYEIFAIRRPHIRKICLTQIYSIDKQVIEIKIISDNQTNKAKSCTLNNV